MIKIKLSLYGPLKNPYGKTELEFDYESGKCFEEFLRDKFNYTEADISFFVLMANGEHVNSNYEIQNSDHLKIFLPVGGG